MGVWRFGHDTHPARTFGLKARKLERVRCSSLLDWPVYPRLRRTMLGSERARNPRHVRRRFTAPRLQVPGEVDRATVDLQLQPLPPPCAAWRRAPLLAGAIPPSRAPEFPAVTRTSGQRPPSKGVAALVSTRDRGARAVGDGYVRPAPNRGGSPVQRAPGTVERRRPHR